MSARYKPDHKTVIDALLLGVEGISTRQMFGHPGYQIAGKMFAYLMEEGVAVKLPPEAVQAMLKQPHVVPFTPMGGTPMRGWVQINLPDADGYRAYSGIFEQAVEYVLEQAATGQ
ncbi:MAG: MmcQ/YjbR family DNA-binding protein [Chloroflexi bacterium]|nr:MmcQ/YjbR family DNA-binding protein [Chloroflexota bacterium]